MSPALTLTLDELRERWPNSVILARNRCGDSTLQAYVHLHRRRSASEGGALVSNVYFVIVDLSGPAFFAGVANEEYVDSGSDWADDVAEARHFVTRAGAELALALISSEPLPELRIQEARR